MRTLIIVHVERGFEGTAPQLPHLAEAIAEYAEDFDRVLNITSDSSLTGFEPYEALAHFNSEEWIWGFDAEYYQTEEPNRWIEGENYISTSGHEFSEILDWMKDLPKSHNYTLVGGACGECLQDIEDIFDHLELPNQVNYQYTY